MSVLLVNYPNSPLEIQKRVQTHRISWTGPLVMLVLRPVLFVLFQAAIAFVLFAWNDDTAWDSSAAWWMLTVTLTNIVCLVVLDRLFQREGMRYIDLLRIERGHVVRDVLLTLGIFILCIPIAFIPNLLAGAILFGDPAVTVNLMFRPIPREAGILLLILFPLTQGLVELPTYFGYVMPRLVALSGRPWLAWFIVSCFLAAQHIAVPFLFDGRFVLWRMFMFLPFAFFVGLMLKWRPRFLPYFLVGHLLIDVQAALMVPWAQ